MRLQSASGGHWRSSVCTTSAAGINTYELKLHELVLSICGSSSQYGKELLEGLSIAVQSTWVDTLGYHYCNENGRELRFS